MLDWVVGTERRGPPGLAARALGRLEVAELFFRDSNGFVARPRTPGRPLLRTAPSAVASLTIELSLCPGTLPGPSVRHE